MQPKVKIDSTDVDENTPPGSTIGQLSLSDSFYQTLSEVTDFRPIAAGVSHSMAIMADGSLWAWGSNTSGQLAEGSRDTHTTPTATWSKNVAKVSLGYFHSLILNQDGSLWGSGYNSAGHLGDGTTIPRNGIAMMFESGVVDMAAGHHHSLVLRDDSSLWVTGLNDKGQLGTGSTSNLIALEQIVSSGVTAIAAGDNHSLFTKDDGSLWAMGYNNDGQLGTGNTTDSSIPVQILSTGVSAIAAGAYHSLVLKTDGSVLAMGRGSQGQLGLGSNTQSQSTPVAIPAMGSGVVAISCGDVHSLFLKEDGSMWGAGYNLEGQLGDSSDFVLEPEEIVSSGVAAISGGNRYTLFMETDGGLKGMGKNDWNQLGDGTTTNRSTPVTILPAGSLLYDTEPVFTLEPGTGSADNGDFSVNGSNQLETSVSFDHEAKDVRNVQIQAARSIAAPIQTALDIAINDINEAPTDIQIDNNTVDERESPGTTVGSLSATDPDDGDSFTFALSSDTGNYPDNTQFEVSGQSLLTTETFFYETQSSYSIELEVTDQEGAGLTFNKVITILVNDVPELGSPYFTSPGTFIFNENQESLTVGTAVAADDEGDDVIYSIIGGADQNLFTIDPETGEISFMDFPDFENPGDADGDNQYEITIQASDGFNIIEQYVTTIVTNTSDLLFQDAAAQENQPAGTVVGSFSLDIPTLEGIDPADAGTKLWEYETSNLVPGSPAIGADGTVYIGSYNKKLYALDGSDGTVKWSFHTGNKVYSSPAIGPDGTVYVANSSGKVSAHNGTDGTQIWEFIAGGAVYSSPALGQDGTVYIGSYDNKVYAIDGSTGSQTWAFTAAGYILSSPAIGPDGTVYAGSGDNKVYALDGTDGTKLWEFTTGSVVGSSPAIGWDGTVYIGSNDKKLYALDGTDGTKLWEFLAGGTLTSSPAIGTDGTVYIGGNDNKVYAVDGSSGALVWEFLAGGKIASSPAIAYDGTLYVGSNDSKLYALDIENGTKQWDFTTGGTVFSAPAIGPNGQVFFGSYDGKVYGLQGLATLASSSWPKYGQGLQRNGQWTDPAPIELVSGTGDSGNGAFRIEGYNIVAQAPLDFETQETYSIRIKGSPPVGPSIERVFTVTITDTNDAPSFTSANSFTFQENTPSLEVGTVTADDQDGDQPNFSIVGGPDQEFFSVGAQDGVLSLNFSPDYEQPTDANGDNVFQVTIEATDGSLSSTQEVMVEVTDNPADAEGIFFSGGSIDENLPDGALAGVLHGTAPFIQNLDPATIGTKLWEFNTSNTVTGSPAIGTDGTVYIGSYSKKVYALDGNTGALQWEFPTAGKVYASPAVGSNGNVYVATDANELLGINGSDGTELWEFTTGGALYSSPSIGSDGTVYIGDYVDKVYAVNGSTGAQVWSFTAGG